MSQDWHSATWRRHHAFHAGVNAICCLMLLGIVVPIAVDFLRGGGGLGTGITGVLGLLLASFLAVRATLGWQQYRRAKSAASGPE